MDKTSHNIQKPLSEEEVAKVLGGNVFGIDILFDGDFAARSLLPRKYWTIGMAQEWQELMAALRLESKAAV